MNSCSGHQRPAASTAVLTGWSDIGSTAAATPSARGEPRLGCRLALALTEHPGPLQADREITVTEVEPDVDAELPQLIHRVEAVVGQAPAALVDPVGQPERDEVRVGGDVGAVDLDVVAGVGDHDELLTGHVEHPAGELGAAGAAGQDHDGTVGAHRPRQSMAVDGNTMSALMRARLVIATALVCLLAASLVPGALASKPAGGVGRSR